MAVELAEHIRQDYRSDVVIIVRMDAGFFDEDNYIELDRHNIGFIASGKKYQFTTDHINDRFYKSWEQYTNDHQIWKFLEFGYRCATWDSFYRALYTVPVSDENGQFVLGFNQSENIILTNIGVNPDVLASCSPEEQRHWLNPQTIIKSRHQIKTTFYIFIGLIFSIQPIMH